MSLITSESAATAVASVAQHLNWTDIPVEHPAEGIERQMVVGERIMIVRFRFVPFLVTPEHTHMHEQMSLVVSGRVRFFVEGEERIASPGDVLHFPTELSSWRNHDGRRSRTHRHLLAESAKTFLADKEFQAKSVEGAAFNSHGQCSLHSDRRNLHFSPCNS
jgi:quercetin dioxygenase-like cupin family protein